MPVVIQLGKDGTIKGVTIPRPGWTSDTKGNVPTTNGQDRRHVVPWIIIREGIISELENKTLAEAKDYLERSFQNSDARVGATLAEITKATSALASEKFNMVENLFAGDSQANRDLGRRIVHANQLLESRNKLDYRDPPKERFPGMDHDIELSSPELVVDWAYNMNIDWMTNDHIVAGKEAFIESLKQKGTFLHSSAVQHAGAVTDAEIAKEEKDDQRMDESQEHTDPGQIDPSSDPEEEEMPPLEDPSQEESRGDE